MPTYRYDCPEHGSFDRWFSIHEDHPTASCAACGAPSLKVVVSPAISVSATPSKAAEAHEIIAREAGWDRDMPAYKRLRNEGLQPPHIAGCAELEAKADYRTEIEMGRRLPKDAAWVGSEIASEMTGQAVGEMIRGGSHATT